MKYTRRDMKAEELARHYRDILQDDRMEINVREDKSVDPSQIFIAGWCDGEDLDFPIEISFIVNNREDELFFDRKELVAIHREFCYTLNHELVHLEQYIDNRDINEEEAYERETSFDLIPSRLMLTPYPYDINRS
jgi:hypothetical protein